MKIDIYTHILPPKYLAAYGKKNPDAVKEREVMQKSLTNLDARFEMMARFPDVLQVLTVSRPPLEIYVSPDDAVELAQIANEELSELVAKYPSKFIAAAACLPMGNIDAALVEVDRAIQKLKLSGIQISSTIKGEPLDDPKFRPLFAKMAEYELPIWIHPETRLEDDLGFVNPFNWPYETSIAMLRLVMSGIFLEYPNIKFIIHHCGAMIPFFEKRVQCLLGMQKYTKSPVIAHPEEHLKKFYNDTAVQGSTGALMCAHAYFGADHLLYGTDAPLGARFGCTGDTIDSIERMDIPNEEKEKIFFKNAMKLLSLSY